LRIQGTALITRIKSNYKNDRISEIIKESGQTVSTQLLTIKFSGRNSMLTLH